MAGHTPSFAPRVANPNNSNRRHLSSTAAILWLMSLIFLSGCACCCKSQDGWCHSDKLQTSTTGGVTTSYTYYTDGRIKQISSPNGASQTFTYNDAATPKTVTEVIASSGHPNVTIVYTLNAQGLAISDSRGTTYQYDSDGHIIKFVYTSYTDARTIINGNVVVETRTGLNPVTFNEMYTPIRNCLDYGEYFLGKPNRNWPLGQLASDGTPPIYYIYVITNGKVVKRTTIGGVSSVTTFTY